tara:strand:- start:563 stop:967 length:405 start_codon:yes stop_codon:yes gene_type:complete
MHIWKFFEISNGIVDKIKEQTKLLKRIQKVLKLEQQLKIHLLLPNATSLFTHTGNLSLESIEVEIKEYPEKEKRIKQLKKRDAAKENKKALKRTADWIQANKHGKTNVLKMLKTMERDGYTIKDVIEELERQLD